MSDGFDLYFLLRFPCSDGLVMSDGSVKLKLFFLLNFSIADLNGVFNISISSVKSGAATQ